MVDRVKVTAPGLKTLKQQKQKIVALTCYDYPMARVLNGVGIDILLVGDSLGMVKQGHSSTLPVTMEEMAYHTRNVARGNSRALLITDMPYLSDYSPERAAVNAGLLLKMGAEGVKLEGGAEKLPVIAAMRRAKIPVMGHLGMTPQSVHVFGGYKVQARERQAVKQLLKDAKALERAGVFAIVLECVPGHVARKVSKSLAIPTIGIGAGVHCDGQILVVDDLLGLTDKPLPRFVKQYAHLRQAVQRAAAQYGREVRSGKFPDAEHSYL